MKLVQGCVVADITKLMELKSEHDQILDQINTLHARAGTIKLALLSQCTHPTTVKKSHHYPGGYFDTAETKYWDECTICGTKLNYTSKRGGYG